MFSSTSWQLQAFDSADFVKNYWQKQPCLFKQAFADMKSPISPEELAGLACEEQVYSRMVLEKGGDSPWQPRYGPFTESDFLSLPDSHYSFLVSECEKWVPEFAELLELFRFIPRWRVDDVMVSYAPTGGSVGPHTDEYDVFLIQLYGHRNWKYTNHRVDNPTLLPGLDLAIMQDFKADQDHILEPGDMLYLPPGVAHHGIAIDSCMTCSVGFRVPTATEVLESFAHEIDKNDLGLKRYDDADLQTIRHFAEITPQEVERFRTMVSDLLEQPAELWLDSIGKLLTDTVNTDFDGEASLADLENNRWIIVPGSKMLYHQSDTQIRFYCNGQMTELENTDMLLDAVQQLCTDTETSPALIKQCKQNDALLRLLQNMVVSGVMVIREES